MKKKILALALALVLSLPLTACSVAGRKVVVSVGNYMSTAFQIGDMKCPRAEALLYFLNYRNLYGDVGGTDLYDGTFDTDRLTESLKGSCIDNLSEVYILNLYAKEQEIRLSESEEERIRTAAAEYFKSLSEEERRFTGAREKDIREMYVRYALAEKVYSGLMESVDEEVSEDEARVMDAYVLYTKEEAKAKEAESSLAAGASFESVLASCGEGDTGLLSLRRKEYPQAVEDVIFRLENEEVSPLITADDGYYIVKCVNKYNEALSEQNKTKILEDRKSEVLTDIFRSSDEKYYSKINESFWKDLSLQEAEPSLTTKDFFLILDKYYKV